MHVWFLGSKGHPGEIAGKNMVRPLSPEKVSLLSRNPQKRFRCWFSGICGWVGLRILGLVLPIILLLRSLMLVVGLLMVILLWMLVSDFLAVTEHRLIPA